MDKGREGGESELSTPPGTAVADRGCHRSTKSPVEAWGATGHEVSRGAARPKTPNPLALPVSLAPNLKMQQWLAAKVPPSQACSICSRSVVAGTRQ